MNRSTSGAELSGKPVQLTRDERALLRRFAHSYAGVLGYGKRFHADHNRPGGPHDWPSTLRNVDTLIRKLHDNPQLAGGLTWPDMTESG